jgi:hypothetical protein
MRHLSDTGKQIEEHMRQTHPGASSLEQVADVEDAVEAELKLEGRPPHPVAALGATFLVIAALVAALTLTALFFIASIIAVPAAIVAFGLLGVWAFWGWEKRHRAAADSGAAST